MTSFTLSTDRCSLFPESGRAQWAQRLGHSSVMEIVTWSGVRIPIRPRTRLSARREKAGLGNGGIQVDRHNFSDSTRTGICPSNICRADLIIGKRLIRPLESILNLPPSILALALSRGLS